MIGFFRRMTLWFLIGIIFLFIFVTLFSALNDIPGQQYFFTEILVCIVYVWCFLFLAQRRYKKMQSVLFDQCDPQQYLELLSKKATKQLFALIEFSRAYQYIGDNERSIGYAEQASKKLRRIPDFSRWRYDFICNSLHFICAINANELEKAELCLERMQQIVEENDSKTSAYPLKTGLINYQYMMRVAKNDYEGADTFYQAVFKNEKLLLNRVIWSWRIGELYMKQNQPEKAREYLEFVVQNGNTTRFVAQAQMLLK